MFLPRNWLLIKIRQLKNCKREKYQIRSEVGEPHELQNRPKIRASSRVASRSNFDFHFIFHSKVLGLPLWGYFYLWYAAKNQTIQLTHLLAKSVQRIARNRRSKLESLSIAGPTKIQASDLISGPGKKIFLESVNEEFIFKFSAKLDLIWSIWKKLVNEVNDLVSLPCMWCAHKSLFHFKHCFLHIFPFAKLKFHSEVVWKEIKFHRKFGSLWSLFDTEKIWVRSFAQSLSGGFLKPLRRIFALKSTSFRKSPAQKP